MGARWTPVDVDWADYLASLGLPVIRISRLMTHNRDDSNVHDQLQRYSVHTFPTSRGRPTAAQAAEYDRIEAGLGPAYDAYVERKIREYADTLGYDVPELRKRESHQRTRRPRGFSKSEGTEGCAPGGSTTVARPRARGRLSR